MKTNYILGVDIGVTSCAAVCVAVDSHNNPTHILANRVQIFSKPYKKSGKARYVSKAQIRREARQQRRQIDRKINRKKALVKWLENNNITSSKEIYSVQSSPQLRAQAASEKISLPQLGAVLLNIARRRGYKGKLSKAEGAVAKGNNVLKEQLAKLNIEDPTIGQLLYHLNIQGFSTRLKNHEMSALREQYEHEVTKILTTQSQYYPQLTNLIEPLVEYLFYQRPLKSVESMVGPCSIEPRHNRALKASPEFQLYRITDLVNNLRLRINKQSPTLLNEQQRNAIIKLLTNPKNLDSNAKITYVKIREHLEDQRLIFDHTQYTFTHEKSPVNAVKGDHTKHAFNKLELLDEWNALDLNNQNRVLKLLSDDSFTKLADDIDTYLTDVTPYSSLKDRNIGSWKKLLYFLTLLVKKKPNPSLSNCSLESGRASYCTKILTKLTAYLQDNPSTPQRDAEAYLKYQLYEQNKGSSLEEIDATWSSLQNNLNMDLLDYIDGIIAHQKNKFLTLENYPLPLKTGNPVVDRALRQTGYVIKSMFKRYGKPLKINIETTRELSFGPKKLNDWKNKQRKNERLNNYARTELAKQNTLATARNIKRFKLWEEQGRKCPYCPKNISFEDAMSGYATHFEHIQPKTETGMGLRMHELVLAHQECNHLKGDRWPMLAFGADSTRRGALQGMIQVFRKNKKNWYSNHKADLLAHEPLDHGEQRPEINDDSHKWAEASMQATGWIARGLNAWLQPSSEKFKIPLFFTKGRFTAKLRKFWQLDDIIPKVRFEENRIVWKIGNDKQSNDVNIVATLDEFNAHLQAKEDSKRSHRFADRDKGYHEQFILKFDKRVDHRHHVIDALVIALSSQSLLQEYRKSELSQKLQSELSQKLPQEKRIQFKPNLPYENLVDDAENMVRNCNLHHTPDRYPPKNFFKDAPRSVVGERLAQRKSVRVFAECKNVAELQKELNKIASDGTKEVFYQHIAKRCRQLNFTIDPDTSLPINLDKQQIAELFKIQGLTETPNFGVEDYRYGDVRFIQKVSCYLASTSAAKATPAWQAKAYQGDILHTHRWQIDGNACLRLDLDNIEESKVLTNIEYYSLQEKPKNSKFIFNGDTIIVNGRKMLVKQFSAASNKNHLVLRDIYESEKVDVLDKKELGDSLSRIVILGKSQFNKLANS